MKKIIFHFSFIIIYYSSFTSAQVNLVPNGSFENPPEGCVLGTSISYATPWFRPTIGSPDLFRRCVPFPSFTVPQNTHGYQNPHTGDKVVFRKVCKA